MNRLLLFSRLLWIAAFAVLLALPSQAQNRQQDDVVERRRSEQRDRNERQSDRTVRIDQTVTAQGGERFQVEGDLRFDVLIRELESGAMQATGQISGNDLTVTRLRDRQVFRASGTERFSKTYRASNRSRLSASTVVGFPLASSAQESSAQEPGHRLYLNLLGELEGQGEVNVRVTDVQIRSRGGRGNDGSATFGRDFEIDGRNARTFSLDRTIVARGGERFQVEGDLALAANVNRIDGDRILVSALADANDLTVTWLDGRQTFAVEGSEKIEETLREPRGDTASFSTVLEYTLVPTRQERLNTAPSYRLYLQLDGDVRRDGTLSIRVSDMEIR